MRRAMAEAEVGDDLLDGDPTTGELEARVAVLLGKEAALFFPSGVMANQAALALHAERGTEVILEAGAHIFHWEMGAAPVLSGLQLRTVPTPDGVLTGAMVEDAIRPESPYALRTSLVTLENTHLASGGRVLPVERVREVRAVADEHGLPLHLDGARLWNAAVVSGAALTALAAPADTVMVSLSKGLGCPVGSLLAGTAQKIERAWRIRRRLGGGMRQTGILAAAGLHALEHHRERLAEDHANARALAGGLEEIPGLSAVVPETNVVMIDLVDPELDPDRLLSSADERGVRLVRFGPRRLRAVTHMDVDREGVERAVAALEEVVESRGSR